MRKILSFILISELFLLSAFGLSKWSDDSLPAAEIIETAAEEKIPLLSEIGTPVSAPADTPIAGPGDAPSENTGQLPIAGEKIPAPGETKWHKQIALPDGRRVVSIPARYETVFTQKEITAATTREIITPEVTKNVTRRVVKTPARIVEKTIPALTEKVQTKVLVQPGFVEEKISPTITRQVVTYDKCSGCRTTETIVVKPQTIDLISVPAQYNTVEVEIVVQEESTELITVPATYETITEAIVVSPQKVEYSTVPATYETLENRILVSPARLVLKNDENQIIHDFVSKNEMDAYLANPDNPDFIPRPAYREITETIVIEPKTVEHVTVPATFETVSETTVAQETSTELVSIPAQYETVTETILVQPESVEFIIIPHEEKRTPTTVNTMDKSRVGGSYGSQSVPETVNVSKITKPARIERRVKPAVTRQITKRVVRQPAGTQERVIPAVTKQEFRRVVKTPASSVEKTVPAKTLEVTGLVPISDGSQAFLPSSIVSRSTNSFHSSASGLFAGTDTVSTSTSFVQNQEKSPLFNWPTGNKPPVFTPPETHLKVNIDYELLQNSDGSEPSLMCVYYKLAFAIENNPIEDCPTAEQIKSLKGYPAVRRFPHGFVILTNPERINNNAEIVRYKQDPNKGDPVPVDKFPVEGLGDYVSVLFTKPTNRFRYFAFIVTSRDGGIEDTGAQATVSGLDEQILAAGTSNILPLELNDIRFSKKHYICEVWIYDFSDIDLANSDLENNKDAPDAKPKLQAEKHVSGSPTLSALKFFRAQ